MNELDVTTADARLEDARRLIMDLIHELAPNRDGPQGEDARLVDDLEYNSLALLELAFTLEDEFELEPIDEETAQRIRTAGDVVGYVLDKLSPGGADG